VALSLGEERRRGAARRLTDALAARNLIEGKLRPRHAGLGRGTFMVLEIIHLIILTATLTCGLVVAFYAHKIHAAQSRELSFHDARASDHRRHRLEARHVRQVWHKEVSNWLGDTRSILGKLYSIAAESSPHERDTRLMPPPAAHAPDTSPMRGTAPISRERMSPSAPLPRAHRGLSPPASASILPPAPARIAAGLGPRPHPTPHLATHRPPRVSVLDPAADRPSWEDRDLDDTGPATDAHTRSAGTMLSMPSVRDPRAVSPIPWIETKTVCRECDGGFVAVANGGIGKCYSCDGSGFNHAL
jgi:hypothetical protein